MDLAAALEALRAARHQLAAAERTLITNPPPIEESSADIVQLKPSAHPVWGGMLLRVKRAHGQVVEGYLLRPHRGGCREAWYRARLCEVTPVGVSIPYPESEWGFRHWYRADIPGSLELRTRSRR